MNNTLKALTLASAFATASLSGAVFFDGFTYDTAANYFGSNSFGGGGAFAVDTTDGELDVLAAGGNTYAVMLNDGSTFLEVGEYFQAASTNGVGGGSPHQYIQISTVPSQPNGSTSAGFRFRRSPTLRVQTYSNGGNTGAATALADPGNAGGLTYRIERETETDFEFLYSTGGDFISVGTYSLLASEVDGEDIFVGVQGWAGTTSWDYIEIGVIPEASALPFLSIGALLALRARRRA